MRTVVTTVVAAIVLALGAPPTAGAITLPSGFQDTPLVNGLAGGTVAIDFAPDGRTFVANAGSGGKIEVVAAGQSTATKTISLTGNVYGIAVDRDFATNGYLYAVRSAGGNTSQRLVRVTVRADSTLAGPETVLLGSVTSNPCPPAANDVDCITATSPHDLNTVHSDPRDGTLWVSNGDGSNVGGAASFNAQDEQSLHGKLLHVDRDGRGLPGHPFCPGDNNLGHVCTKIAAKGFRNPFRFAMRPGGDPVLGDVGWSQREEVDIITPGGNYGWPCYEGTIRTPNYRDDPRCSVLYAKAGTADAAVPPIHDYPHPAAGAAITGGPVYRGPGYPAGYAGSVFFADYVNGFIKRLTLTPNGGLGSVYDFATGAGSVVDLALAPNGDLVYVLLNGQVRRVSFAGSANRAPIARASANTTSGPVPLTVAFRGADSVDPDGDALTYEWDFGDGTAHATAANPSHPYTRQGSFTASLTVRDGRGGTDTATVPISAGNRAPVVDVTAPATWKAGDDIVVRGSASDPEDGPLSPSRFVWKVGLVHVDHVHDPDAPAGVSQISFKAPIDHDSDSHYEVTLSATDSAGTTGSKTIRIEPRTRQLTVASLPAGAPISFAGRDFTAPLVKQSTVGYVTPVAAAERFSSGGRSYQFDGWSDGQARAHEITVPDADSILTARYTDVGPGGADEVAFEAESMSGVISTGNARSLTRTDASGGREVFMLRNSTITKTLLLPAANRITIRARGDQCAGAPIMVVKIDGIEVMSVPVGTTSFADYAADISTPAGSRKVDVSFINDYGKGCDRNLRVDKVTFSSAGSPPPPPPPPPPSGNGFKFEAETMAPISSTGNARSVARPDASGGREVLIVRNASISRTLSLPASQRIRVRARGDQCGGAPTMAVSVDGAPAMTVPVPSTGFADYEADLASPQGISTGSHTVAVAFTNDYAKGCDRNLRLDSVELLP